MNPTRASVCSTQDYYDGPKTLRTKVEITVSNAKLNICPAIRKELLELVKAYLIHTKNTDHSWDSLKRKTAHFQGITVTEKIGEFDVVELPDSTNNLYDVIYIINSKVLDPDKLPDSPLVINKDLISGEPLINGEPLNNFTYPLEVSEELKENPTIETKDLIPQSDDNYVFPFER